MNQSVTRSFWIHALSPLHVGAGRGIGFIDLPIVREAVTNWPYLPGSAIKGVLADYHDAGEDARKADPLKKLAFGSAGNEYANSGALVFSDARLVCLPVRSLYGTFAWCTSPLALERLRRDMTDAERNTLPAPPKPESEQNLLLASEVPAVAKPESAEPNAQLMAYFEDLDFKAQWKDEAAKWAASIADRVFAPADTKLKDWRAIFIDRFAIVHDDVFNFLCETATQVDARVRIDENSKTVADGQLWYEESLPAETILAGLAWCGPVFEGTGRGTAERRDDLMKTFCSRTAYLQVGGKATIGRGQVRMAFSE